LRPNLKYFKRYLIITIAFSLIVYVSGTLRIGYSILEYLFYGNGAYGDFINPIYAYKSMYSPKILIDNPSYSEVFSPPVNVMSSLFEIFISRTLDAQIFLLFFWVITLYLINKLVGDWQITLMLGFTFPVLFTFGRGNQDYIIGVLTALLIFNWNSKKLFLISPIILGLIVSIKINYIYFLLPYIFKRKFTLTILTLIYFSVLFITPIYFKDENGTLFEQISVFVNILQNYNSGYAIYGGGSLHNSSFFGLETIFLQNYLEVFYGGTEIENFRSILEDLLSLHYFFIFLFLSFITMYIAVFIPNLIKSVNFSELFLFCNLIFILVSPVSAHYRMMNTVIIVSGLIYLKSKLIEDRIFLAILCTLLAPKTFLFWQNSIDGSYSTLDSIINPILILTLIFRIMYFWKSRVGTKEVVLNRNF